MYLKNLSIISGIMLRKLRLRQKWVFMKAPTTDPPTTDHLPLNHRPTDDLPIDPPTGYYQFAIK